MNPWSDGLSALYDHIPAVIIFLFFIVWGLFATCGFLFHYFDASLNEADLLSLSAAGWALPVFILSLLTFAVSSLINATVGGAFAFILIILPIFILPKKKPQPFIILSALVILIPIFILRFAFIRDLPLPSYFDSAEHYRLIRTIVETYQTGISGEILNGGYYHLGYHHILASLAYFFKQDIADLMLVSGPLLLAILPFTFYFLVKRETESSHAALFACLLAGFGFHMPAHLMNWGKYPALLSLFFIPFVLGLIQILYRNDAPKKRVLPLPAAAILVSTFIHSRTLILYSLLLPAILLTLVWERLSKPHRIAGSILLISLLALELFFIQQNPALKTLSDLYLKNDFPILILIPSLTLFSAYQFPRPTFLLLSWFALATLCLFIPITIPIHGIQTLLDRPFVQMFAFIPLSLLSGLGLSGLIHALTRLLPSRMLIQRFVIVFLFGFVLLNAALNYDLHPSACCRFVTRDDLAALSWLDQATPPDAKILVAATGLYVTSFESVRSQTGVDAGIWIPPLLSQPIELSGTDIQFDRMDVHQDLCRREISYIYVGATPQSFDSLQLNDQPGWYRQTFALPLAKIYQLEGCN